MALTKAASVADDLVRRFERRIASGELAPGSRYPTENAVREDFGVSRNVVREAYARLAARGLLASRRGSGAYVPEDARYQAFQVSAEDVRDVGDVLKLLEMRVAMEAEMADLAARRRNGDDLAAMRAALKAMADSVDVDESIAADTAFHAAIARATRNEHFLRFTDFLGVRLVPSRRLYLQSNDLETHRRYARIINEDHHAIHAEIEAGDAAAARAAARLHIERSADRHRTLRPDAGAAPGEPR